MVTFDCYGTLIDWEAGIARAFRDAAEAADRPFTAADAVRAHAEIEPRVEAEGYRSYRDVLRETARRVAARMRWPPDPGGGAFLADSVPSWTPFPDTNAALLRLSQAGVSLGILSNVDEDLLDATVRHFPVRFEVRVTAEQVRSYKPAAAHFLAARAALGGRRWLHAAQSYFHDVAPAKALGVPVVWVNRKGETAGPAGPPLHETRDLAGLADWLIGG